MDSDQLFSNFSIGFVSVRIVFEILEKEPFQSKSTGKKSRAGYPPFNTIRE